MHHLLHDVEGGHDEGDPDIIVALLQLPDQLLPRRVLEHRGGGVEIDCDVFKGELRMKGTGAEHPLGPGHLSVKKLVANTGAVAIRLSQWPANTGKQDFLHNAITEKLLIFLLKCQDLLYNISSCPVTRKILR